jgi:hypothetical protein
MEDDLIFLKWKMTGLFVNRRFFVNGRWPTILVNGRWPTILVNGRWPTILVNGR